MVIHVVRPGETIQSIARQYGLPPGRIITDNELENPDALVPGQALVILFPAETYVVQGGDTLYTIAREYGVSVNQLWRNNPVLGGMSAVYPGQVLTISYSQPKIGTIYTNGYAYPFIDEAVLRKTLPYLSYLSIFTYGITNDGRLIPPDNDQKIIGIAHEYGIAPLMMLSSLTEAGTFSNELATAILESPELQARLIEQIYQTIVSKRYAGVDVDFEYISRQSADQYVNFIANLRRRLAPDGYVVFVALAPKSAIDQPGLLYEGHKYAELGMAADAVLVMTYEWGYTYGPPMAVAPLDQVRLVLDFSVSQIRPDKIFMGMPNYGYDWPLPYVRGETAARPLSNMEATSLAAEKKVPILFDPVAKAPYFTYLSNDSFPPQEHIVWFQDARSVEASLNLVSEYDLKGVSIWQIMKYFPQNWLVLNSLFNIVRIYD